MYPYGYKGKVGCGCCGHYILRCVVGKSNHRRSHGMRRVDHACKASARQQARKEIKNYEP